MTTFTTLAALQNHFSDRYPRMARQVEGHFRHLDPDKREEAVTNTLGLAWKFFYFLYEEERATKRMLGSVLWYAIKQTKIGRKAQGKDGRIAKCAIDYRNRGRLNFEWIDLDGFFGRNTPIPDQVSFRLDVPRFFATLDDRQQRMAYDLAIGNTTGEVAKRFSVTPGAVSQFRRRFKVLFDKFFDV